MEVTEHTAAEQIKAAERLLRETVARQLAEIHGIRWEENELSTRVRETLERIRNAEREARPHALDEPNLLGYAGFDQLKAVFKHHWTCCFKALDLWPSEAFAILELDRLHAVRNPAQHGRTLFPHEYVEGEGLARRLRFDIERQRRKAATVADQYWLYIEEAEDSLGNRAANRGADVMVEVHAAGPILVGDTVTVRTRAFDPWGWKLQYRLITSTMTANQKSTDWRDLPEFEWAPEEAARRVVIDIEVRAIGEPHANPGSSYDTFARFIYEVRQPGLSPTT